MEEKKSHTLNKNSNILCSSILPIEIPNIISYLPVEISNLISSLQIEISNFIASLPKIEYQDIHGMFNPENLIIYLILVTLGGVLSGILYMDIKSLLNPVDEKKTTSKEEPKERRLKLSELLTIQYNSNLQRGYPLPYNQFPVGDPGHLALDRQIALAQIIGVSPETWDFYRLGSAPGSIYKKWSTEQPCSDQFMINAVLRKEPNYPGS